MSTPRRLIGLLGVLTLTGALGAAWLTRDTPDPTPTPADLTHVRAAHTSIDRALNDLVTAVNTALTTGDLDTAADLITDDGMDLTDRIQTVITRTDEHLPRSRHHTRAARDLREATDELKNLSGLLTAMAYRINQCPDDDPDHPEDNQADQGDRDTCLRTVFTDTHPAFIAITTAYRALR